MSTTTTTTTATTTTEPKYADCEAAKKAGLTQNGIYNVSDGSAHYCDMSTDGGGWTLLMRINKDTDWIPKYGKSATAEEYATANLWHFSHWRQTVDLAPGEGLESGISTNPSNITAYKGAGDWELRYTLFPKEDSAVGDAIHDGVITLSKANGKNVFAPNPDRELVNYAKGKKFSFRKLKGNPNGDRLCWTCSRNSYEGGLHIGQGGNCHLNNNRNVVMLKSHLGHCNSACRCNRWSGHGFLEKGRLQVASKKIVVWIRRQS